MENNTFDKVNGKWKDIEPWVKQLLEDEMPSIVEEVEYSNCQCRLVKAPFILSDNFFDLAEANNTLEEINAHRVGQSTFTGGNMYIIFDVIDKSKPSVVLHGNEEEGFNIFILN